MTDHDLQTWSMDAPLNGVAVDRGSGLAAFACGDGAVRIVPLAGGGEMRAVFLTDGAVLALAPDCHNGAFLAGADDGAVYRVDADGAARLLQLDVAWPDQMATHSCGLRAVADGRTIRMLNGQGDSAGTLNDHPSTVAGMAFDQTGSRLAVSHYDGASIWNLSTRIREQLLRFHGSHLMVTWRPNGHHLVTTTQEKMLHAWDLLSGEDVSLGPCFNKTKSLAWSADGVWLQASGNDTLSAWRFDRGLPRPAPKLLGRFSEDLIGQVCPHPTLLLTAVGYNDGGLELTALASRTQRHVLISPSASPVSAMAWSPDGNHLVGGDQNGRFFVFRLDVAWLDRLTQDG